MRKLPGWSRRSSQTTDGLEGPEPAGSADPVENDTDDDLDVDMDVDLDVDMEETVELHLTTVGSPAVRHDLGSGAKAGDSRDASSESGAALDVHTHRPSVVDAVDGAGVEAWEGDGADAGASAGDNDVESRFGATPGPTGALAVGVWDGDAEALARDRDMEARVDTTPAPTGATAVDDDSVRAARRRFVRRRWARRWLAWRRLVAVVLVVALVAGTAWLVFFSSVLAVGGVRVEGTGVLSADAVRRVAEVPTGAPLATVDLDSVAARVGRLPAVESVDVSRAWPDRVRIDVTERRVVAVVAPSRPGDRFRGTDADGVVFRSYARRPRGLPLIRMPERTDAEALSEAAAVSGSLPAAIAERVAEVRVRTVDTISLSLRDGRTVRWGSVDGSADKARVLAVLLRQRASFIDVSVPGRPVIRR